MRDDHLDGEGRELEVVVDQNPPEDEDHYQTPKLSRCNNDPVFYNLSYQQCTTTQERGLGESQSFGIRTICS